MKPVSYVIILAIILAILPTLGPAASAAPITPTQTTTDLELTKGGGWTEYVDGILYWFVDNVYWNGASNYIYDTGTSRIYRYVGTQYIGGYFAWHPYLSLGGAGGATDAYIAAYSYGFESYTSILTIFFDGYSVDNLTYDMVTDITVANTTGVVTGVDTMLYATAIGFDNESWNISVPIFHSGIYEIDVSDNDFFSFAGLGPGYYDIDLATARAIFGGDTNVYGIALTTVAWNGTYPFAAGFFVYNYSGYIMEWPIVFRFDANVSNGFNAANYDLITTAYFSTYHYPEAWRPVRSFIYNGSLWIVGYHYIKTTNETIDPFNYRLIHYFVAKINLSTLSFDAYYLIPAASGSYVVPALMMFPYTHVFALAGANDPAFWDNMGIYFDDRDATLYIAAYGADANGDYAARIIAYNLTGGTTKWSLNIGNTSTTTYIVDFATGIDLTHDTWGNEYLVATGSLTYAKTDNFTGLNAFYAVIDKSGNVEYIMMVGGNATDIAADLAHITANISYGGTPKYVIRPFYTALVSNSEVFYICNVTEDYPTVLGPASTVSTSVSHVKADLKIYSVPGAVKPEIKPIDTPILTPLQYTYMHGALLQPGLPPATDIEVTYEPADGFYLWKSTTKYVLINITAVLTENWTGAPLSGVEVTLALYNRTINDYVIIDTQTTNSTGGVFFQYNATEPGWYTFEVIFFGTVFHYRAFEFFTIQLAQYWVNITLVDYPQWVYTLYDDYLDYVNITVKLELVNMTSGSPVVTPLANQTVILDIYIDPFVQAIMSSDFGYTPPLGWLYDNGVYFTSHVATTNDTGYAVISLNMTHTVAGYLLYWYSHNYTFRIVYPGNETLRYPENMTDPFIIESRLTPTQIQLVSPSPVPTEVEVGEELNFTILLVYSHDGFTTTHPLPGAYVRMYLYMEYLDGSNETFYIEGLTGANGNISYVFNAPAAGNMTVWFEFSALLNDVWYINNIGTDPMYRYLFDDSFLGNYTLNVTPIKVNVTVVQTPPSTASVIDILDERFVIRVVRSDTGEPVEYAVIWFYVGDTIVYGYTNANGYVNVTVYDILYTANISRWGGLFLGGGVINASKLPEAGILNITWVFNGTKLIPSVPPTFDYYAFQAVTGGGVHETLMNLKKANVTLEFFNVPPLFNVTQTYTIGVRAYAEGYLLADLPVTVTLDGTPVSVTTGATGEATVTFRFDTPGNKTIEASFGGSGSLNANSTSIEVPAKWWITVDLLENLFTATPINDTHALITMYAKVTGHNFTDNSEVPLAGVPVTFYYIASIHILGTNTTGSDGVATFTGTVPREGVQGFGAQVGETATTQSGSDEIGVLSLPGDVLQVITPAPEPPVLPLLLLLAALLLALRKRK